MTSLFKREPAILIAIVVMAGYTIFQMVQNDLPLDTVMTDEYMTYIMGGIMAIATRLKVLSPATVDRIRETQLVDSQDQFDVPDVPYRKF